MKGRLLTFSPCLCSIIGIKIDSADLGMADLGISAASEWMDVNRAHLSMDIRLKADTQVCPQLAAPAPDIRA